MSMLENFRKKIMKRVVTKSDIGKKFKENIEGNLVTLKEIREDGWFNVFVDKEGSSLLLPPNTLIRLDDNELLNSILDEPRRQEKLRIQTLDKITMIGRNSDGDRVEQVLEGSDAELWHDYVRGLSLITYLRDKISFDFAHLKWKKKITTKS